ncbi:uncharacterized protein BKA78DRAFT_8474 [Phyllosticta capitalensis]|uniref:uncharacterized protein n=1 Tax=Phyllosticta capitalensis TaxID=121624 RepID=UPI00312DCB5A
MISALTNLNGAPWFSGTPSIGRNWGIQTSRWRFGIDRSTCSVAIVDGNDPPTIRIRDLDKVACTTTWLLPESALSRSLATSECSRWPMRRTWMLIAACQHLFNNLSRSRVSISVVCCYGVDISREWTLCHRPYFIVKQGHLKPDIQQKSIRHLSKSRSNAP